MPLSNYDHDSFRYLKSLLTRWVLPWKAIPSICSPPIFQDCLFSEESIYHATLDTIIKKNPQYLPVLWYQGSEAYLYIFWVIFLLSLELMARLFCYTKISFQRNFNFYINQIYTVNTPFPSKGPIMKQFSWYLKIC